MHCTLTKALTDGGLIGQSYLYVAGSGFEAQFDFSCQKSAVPLVRDPSVVKAYLSLFAGDDNDAFPYGVDPAFLRSSQALYQPELQGKEGWYYNTTDPAKVPPTTKAPYGFFHRHLQVSVRMHRSCLWVEPGEFRLPLLACYKVP